MNAPAHRPRPSAANREPVIDASRLHDLTQRAIAASIALTAASTANIAMNDAEYAHIDRAAYAARHDLLDCLRQDYGIDQAMADQLGALL